MGIVPGVEVLTQREVRLPNLTKYEIFANAFLGHFLQSKTAPHHREIYRAIQDAERAIVIAPTRWAKSALTQFIKPMVDAIGCFHTNILLISATGALAESWLNKIKLELETNKNLISRYGNLRGRKWSSEQITLTNGSTVTSKGLGYQIRGFGYDLILPDDLETKEMVRSETQRQQFEDWFRSDLLGRAEPGCQIIWDGTFLNQTCFIRKAFKNLVNGFETWQKKIFYALDDNGKSTWEDRWSTDNLEKQRNEMGWRAFQAEKMNNPQGSENQVFQEDWLRYYEKAPTGQLAIAIGFDPNEAKTEVADYGAIQVWGKDLEDNYYLLDYNRGRWGMFDGIRALVDIDKKWKSRACIVESRVKDNQDWRGAIKREADNQRCFVPTRFIKPDADKVSRARHITELFEKGKVYFPKDPKVQAVIDELLEFPEGEFDDWIDAMVYALTYLKTQKAGTTKKQQTQIMSQLKPDPITGRLK